MSKFSRVLLFFYSICIKIFNFIMILSNKCLVLSGIRYKDPRFNAFLYLGNKHKRVNLSKSIDYDRLIESDDLFNLRSYMNHIRHMRLPYLPLYFNITITKEGDIYYDNTYILSPSIVTSEYFSFYINVDSKPFKSFVRYINRFNISNNHIQDIYTRYDMNDLKVTLSENNEVIVLYSNMHKNKFKISLQNLIDMMDSIENKFSNYNYFIISSIGIYNNFNICVLVPISRAYYFDDLEINNNSIIVTRKQLLDNLYPITEYFVPANNIA